MTGFGGFDKSRSKRVLDVLKTIYFERLVDCGKVICGNQVWNERRTWRLANWMLKEEELMSRTCKFVQLHTRTHMMMMMMMMKLPILPCAGKLELVLSTAPKTSHNTDKDSRSRKRSH